MEFEIELKGEILKLLPESAVWWQKEKTLIISDLHWGKSAHFRKNGIAIPIQSQQSDEKKLSLLIEQKNPQRLLIAGDLFHSSNNLQVEDFSRFRSRFASLNMELIAGNHDILQKEQYKGFSLKVHREYLELPPFCIAHDFLKSKHFVIHGHLHPSVRIKTKGFNQPGIKLRCFARTEDRLILPAFGSFTGSHILNQEDFHHLYLIAEDNIIQWK